MGGRIILKYIFKNEVLGRGLDSPGTGWFPKSGSFSHSNKASCYKRGEIFLDSLND